MRRSLILPTAAVLATLALSGCSASGFSTETSSGGGDAVAPAPDVAYQSGSLESGAVADESGGRDMSATDADREVITTGYVTVTVEQPTDAAAEAIRIVEAAGGRVDGRTEYAPQDETDKGSASLTLRIPSAVLTATLDKFRELGDVQEVSLYSSDVTMETQDLDARITALRASVDRLLTLLSTATDTDALIQLETAISDRQAELESLESQRRYYSDQVDLSTIELSLVSEYAAPAVEPDTFLSGLEAGWNAFVAFFAGLLVALGVLLPWLVFAAIVTVVIIVLVRRRRGAATAAEVAPPAAAEVAPPAVAGPAKTRTPASKK